MNDAIWQSPASLEKYLEEVIRSQTQKVDDDGNVRHKYRNVWNMPNLKDACSDIKSRFEAMGYQVKTMSYEAIFSFPPKVQDEDGNFIISDTNFSLWKPPSKTVTNLIVDIKGSEHTDEIIILGAHYDSRTAMEGITRLGKQRGRVPDYREDPTKDSRWNTPGANDNGSGVAALLALAAAFKGQEFERSLRFVAWVNEEFPFYSNRYVPESGSTKYIAEGMGSYRHAKRCAGKDGTGERENIVCAISFDTMGCYHGKLYIYPGRHIWDNIAIGSQKFSPIGDYVAFLANDSTREIAENFAKCYDSQNPEVRCRSWSAPPPISWYLERKSGWSDDWSFWQFDYPAFTVTDTAYLRSPRYHRNDDTVEHIDFPQFARVVWRLRDTLAAFANREF